jgi:hypothetical protein
VSRLEELRAVLEQARPAIERNAAPTKEQQMQGADRRGFPASMSGEEQIKAMAALYELDHRLWPSKRETIIALVELGEELAGGLEEYGGHSQGCPKWSGDERACKCGWGEMQALLVAYKAKREELEA